QAAHQPFRVRSAYCPNPTCQSLANCWPVPMVPPVNSPCGNASADAASLRTRWLLPAGEGKPTTALTTPSSDPSPFGPHPDAPGTANVSSPWRPPVIKSEPSAPTKSGTPVGSKPKKPPTLMAFDRSVFWGLRRIGFWSDPMKQLGPSAGFSRWILIGIVMIGTPVWIPANRLKFDGRPADWVTAVTTPTGALGIGAQRSGGRSAHRELEGGLIEQHSHLQVGVRGRRGDGSDRDAAVRGVRPQAEHDRADPVAGKHRGVIDGAAGERRPRARSRLE